MEQIPFVSSAPNTLGIELELQLIDPTSYDLTAASDELLAQMANHPIADRVKPEITRSMIELNSSVHEHPMGLLAEMREMRDALVEAADAVGVSVAGGGAHPFMRWQERSISDTPRFQYLAEMYGYLARQFTVFGQHIHLGVKAGRRHPAGAPPVALCAPFHRAVGVLALLRGRGHAVLVLAPERRQQLPAGRPHATGGEGLVPVRGPPVATARLWPGREHQDLYWDIRPKPEFGTVEIRVCDTPLTVERACQIAALAQALAVLLMREPEPSDKAWLSYRSNHFQACRFGLQGSYVTPTASACA